jgi:hypothetical protein
MRPTKGEFLRRAPRPASAFSRRLKSASQGAPRQASASADAKNPLPVGAGRPSAEGPSRPNSFGAQADRRPKAFMPIEIGPSRRLRARRRPPCRLQRTPSRSAQADRWPKAPGGRIHSARRPTVGRRLLCRLKSAPQGAPRQASASADAKPPPGRRRPTVGRRLLCRLKSASQGAPRQASASADAKNPLLVGTGRPSAEGFCAD